MPILVYGLDFTSAPGKRKPITCASASLRRDFLRVRGLERFEGFQDFEAFLRRPGPWIAGMDFPFGQPRRLLAELGHEESWADAVTWLTARSRDEFVNLLDAFRERHPTGEKQPFRVTDRRAGSCSPMTCYGTPVAKMFFEGAPRLLSAGVCVYPVHARNDSRMVVEAYPKLVAARFIDGAYKSDAKRGQTPEQHHQRKRIVRGLIHHALGDFGFGMEVAESVKQVAELDPTGDSLDAVLCAVQAAWSVRQTHPPHGIPVSVDPLEGWIVDPQLLG